MFSGLSNIRAQTISTIWLLQFSFKAHSHHGTWIPSTSSQTVNSISLLNISLHIPKCISTLSPKSYQDLDTCLAFWRTCPQFPSRTQIITSSHSHDMMNVTCHLVICLYMCMYSTICTVTQMYIVHWGIIDSLIFSGLDELSVVMLCCVLGQDNDSLQ